MAERRAAARPRRLFLPWVHSVRPTRGSRRRYRLARFLNFLFARLFDFSACVRAPPLTLRVVLLCFFCA